MNIPEKIVNEWFNRLDKGYAVEPYTKRELRILHNVIKDNAELIHEQLYGGSELLTEVEFPYGELLRRNYHMDFMNGIINGLPMELDNEKGARFPDKKVVIDKEFLNSYGNQTVRGVENPMKLKDLLNQRGKISDDAFKEYVKAFFLNSGEKYVANIPVTGVKSGKKYNIPLNAISKTTFTGKGGSDSVSAADFEVGIAVQYNMINGDLSESEALDAAEVSDNERKKYLEQVQDETNALMFRTIASRLGNVGALMKATGSKTTPPSSFWKSNDGTWKTDVYTDSSNRFSLKKAGGSQLMSERTEGVQSVFESAIQYYSKYEGTEALNSGLDAFMKKTQEDMKKFDFSGIGGLKTQLHAAYKDYRFDEVSDEVKRKGIKASETDINMHVNSEASALGILTSGMKNPKFIEGVGIMTPKEYNDNMDDMWAKINKKDALNDDLKSVLKQSVDNRILDDMLSEIFRDDKFKTWVVYEAASGTFKFTGDVEVNTTYEPVANKMMVFSETGNVSIEGIDREWASGFAKKVRSTFSFKSSGNYSAAVLRLVSSKMIDEELNILNENISKVFSDTRQLINEGLYDRLSRFGKKAWDKLKSVSKKIWDGINDAMRKFYNNIILKMFNKLKELAKQGMDSLMKFLGITADFTGSSIDVSF